MSELPDSLYDRVHAAAQRVRERCDVMPQVGLILGSGLGGFAEGLENQVAIDYAELPNFPRSHVQGHKGRLVLGVDPAGEP